MKLRGIFAGAIAFALTCAPALAQVTPGTSPLSVAKGGTAAAAKQGAFNNLAPTPTRAGDITYWNGSNYVNLPGNNSATNCIQENASGVPSFGPCSGVPSLNGQTGALTFYQTPQIRLTLTQGTPVTTSDVTSATSLFLEPYNGAQITIYDGSANWVPLPVAASTYSLPATQTQSGTTHTNTLLDGLTDTSQMVVGEQVTGTNIAANSVISVINSLTSVTLNNATTGSATNSMTFKLPPATNYDVLAINNSGVPKLLWSAAWSNDTTPPTRATQNGVLVTSGTTTQRVLGSVRTTSIAGQLEDSALHGWVSNLYNPQPRSIKITDATSSWPYATAQWRQADGSAANQGDVIFCVALPISLSARHMFQVSTTTPTNGWTGIGIDSTTVSSSTLSIGGTTSATAATIVNLAAEYEGVPGIGHHTLPWLEYGATNGTFTGTAGTVDGRAQSGMVGWAYH